MSHPCPAASERKVYSAAILSRPADIIRLKDSVLHLMPAHDHWIMPGFFLASLSKGWIPRVVAVSRGNEVAGIVYAKERRVAGLPLGVIYADNSFGNVVVAAPAEREDVLQAAIRRLLAPWRVRGLRLVIPPNGFEARSLEAILSAMKLEASYTSSENHACLALPKSYEEFLKVLSPRTRRNFRCKVKRCEADGHIYEERLSEKDLHTAAWEIRPKCSISISRDALTRTLTWLSAADRPLAVGLRRSDGGWLSVAAGWYGSGSATVAVQLNNDLEFGALSLSLVLRARLIETLIRQGIGDLWFWAGTSAPLARYATYLRTTGVYLDRPTPESRLVRFLAAKLGPLLPKHIAADISWIARPSAPASDRQEERGSPVAEAEGLESSGAMGNGGGA